MRRTLPLLAAAFLLTGCFSMEIGLDLDREHSRTVSFDVTMDLEPMAYMVASMTKAFSGEEGPPTEADLPEGIDVVDVQHRSDGLKEGYAMTFSFQHLDQLKQLDLDTSDPSEPDPMAEPPSEFEDRMQKPYSGFTPTDEGSTWRLGTEPMNPLEAAKEDIQMRGMEGMGP